MNALETTVAALLTPGKGLLAADESFPTLGKRFQALGIESTEESRRAYRDMLFSTPGLGEFISGAILFDETMRQTAGDGVAFPEFLARRGIVPGIKVDRGTVDLASFPGEKITEGLDGLRGRLIEYRQLGARFTKWRAVIAIGDGLPTGVCLETNSRLLALFAALSQEADLVPIVEPEVLMNGSHSLARCEEVLGATLEAVFGALCEGRVVLEQMILKTGMALPGAECPQQASVEEVAAATLRCFRRHVPSAVPGIVFLSGGQSDEIATERLSAIYRAAEGPWKLSFSFGRALQAPALERWKGSADHIAAAQEALHWRSRCNSLAVRGEDSERAEKADA